jgi:hypothetical protein
MNLLDSAGLRAIPTPCGEDLTFSALAKEDLTVSVSGKPQEFWRCIAPRSSTTLDGSAFKQRTT